MLQATDLSVTIAGRDVLDRISVIVPPGTSLAIVGPSGSGKTTLLNVLSLVLSPHSGTLSIDGVDCSRVSDRARQRFWAKKAGFVLQDFGLIDGESAAYNVLLSKPPFFKRQAVRDANALRALASVGLEDRAATQVSALSGGERQRVSIARALYKQASYVFADEPTASLDSANRERVQSLLLDSDAGSRTMIISTHDLALAERCDARIELEGGRIRGAVGVDA